jgi:hypothetical protein
MTRSCNGGYHRLLQLMLVLLITLILFTTESVYSQTQQLPIDNIHDNPDKVVDLDEIPNGCFGVTIGHEKKIGCEPEFLRDLKFCSFMNGQQTDHAYSSMIVDSKTKETYAEKYDKALEQAFKKINGTFASAMKELKGSVCNTCYQRLKTLMCMNAFPASGYRSCIVNAMVKKYTQDKDPKKEICPGLCPLVNDGLCAIDKSGKYQQLKQPGINPKTLECITRKMSGITELYRPCNVYLSPMKRCLSTMSSCGCVAKEDVKRMCSVFYNNIGLRDVKVWPKGNCADDKQWCAKKKDTSKVNGLIKTPSVVGKLVCPNQRLCIGNVTPIPYPSPLALFSNVNTERISGSLACGIKEDDLGACQTGCTNPDAFKYDPFARIRDRSCDAYKDGHIWVVYWQDNVAFIIFVLIVLLGMIASCICGCTLYCCFRCSRCCCVGKIIVEEWKYERYDY